MKIMYVLPISWGGIPHYTVELANAVSKYEDVVVFKPNDSNNKLFSQEVSVVRAFKPMSFSRKRKIGAFTFNDLNSFFSFRNIGLVDSINPDIIHFPELYPQSSIFTLLYRIADKYPIVNTLHATFESPLSLLSTKNFTYSLLASATELLKYPVLAKSDAIIVHTKKDKDILVARRVKKEKIKVIPHGAYSLFRKYDENRVVNEETCKNCILFFGYITEQKGINYLIDAASIVAEEIPNINVIIAGEGDLPSNLLRTRVNLEVYNEFVSNEMVARLFQRARIVVLPYIHHTGHSGVLNIARAFGKPVIVTNVGDLSNMIEDGEDGLIVPPRSSQQLANAIVRLLKDDELIKSMERNVLTKAQKLSWDNIAKMHLNVYREVLESKPKGLIKDC